MAPGFAHSRVMQFLLRLWGVDTNSPMPRRGGPADVFDRAKARRIYTRNGVRVTISPGRFHDND